MIYSVAISSESRDQLQSLANTSALVPKMPGQPYLLRYFITLRPKATFPSYYEWMQLIYQNNGWLIEGHGGYEGPSAGDWEALIKPGPWWDGTKPQFVLKDSTWLPMSHDDVLDMLMDCYALEDIWISWTMKEYKRPGGCVVWVQKADTPNPNHWHVWHTPMIDMGKVLLTHPNDWTDWGWYDDVTSAPVVVRPNAARAQEQRTLQDRGNTTSSSGCHPNAVWV